MAKQEKSQAKKSKTLSKGELINIVNDKCGTVSKAETKRIVDGTFVAIADALKSGQSVQLAGFGTIEVYTRKKHKYVNPLTKAVETAPARKAVHFKAGKALKESVNKKK